MNKLRKIVFLPRFLALFSLALISFYSSVLLRARVSDEPTIIFEGSQKIGEGLPGEIKFDPRAQTYTVAGGGGDLWFASDDFYFAWRKVSGDASISADVSFLGVGKNGHRKAVLMIRQSLDANSAYADIALHGDGLTSLQYRDSTSGTTHEI